MSCLASKNKLSYNDALLQYRKTYKQSFLDDERAPLKEEDLVHLNFLNLILPGEWNVPVNVYMMQCPLKCLCTVILQEHI